MLSKALSWGGAAGDAILERRKRSRKAGGLSYPLEAGKFRVCPCLI